MSRHVLVFNNIAYISSRSVCCMPEAIPTLDKYLAYNSTAHHMQSGKFSGVFLPSSAMFLGPLNIYHKYSEEINLYVLYSTVSGLPVNRSSGVLPLFRSDSDSSVFLVDRASPDRICDRRDEKALFFLG